MNVSVRTNEITLKERSQEGGSQQASSEEGPPELGLSGHGDGLRYHPGKVQRVQAIPEGDGMILECPECRSLVGFPHLLRPSGNQGTVLQTPLYEMGRMKAETVSVLVVALSAELTQ